MPLFGAIILAIIVPMPGRMTFSVNIMHPKHGDTVTMAFDVMSISTTTTAFYYQSIFNFLLCSFTDGLLS